MYAYAVTDVRSLGFMPVGGLALIFHLMAAMGSQLSAFILAYKAVNGFMGDVYTLHP